MFGRVVRATISFLVCLREVETFTLPVRVSAKRNHLKRTLSTTTRSWTISLELPRKNATELEDPIRTLQEKEDRFARTAATNSAVDEPCIIKIQGHEYNMTAWANAHPGGPNILKKFHNKDATEAFIAAGHSREAIKMLYRFVVSKTVESSVPKEKSLALLNTSNSISEGDVSKFRRLLHRLRVKLFTKEDPGIHKLCGIFALVHFIYRFGVVYFGDLAGGYGTKMQTGSSRIFPLLCLLPHSVLSISSLIFYTVPRERIVGKPMIWKEFRGHSIIFGLRSVICCALTWLAIRRPDLHRFCVTGSTSTVLAALLFADFVTAKLRENNIESTTATMPYWEGCSVKTQKRFKSFYSYCQFVASIGCLITWNPVWPLLILFPIQFAPFLMTLVRKGLISAKGYHYGYTVSLIMPYIALFRASVILKSFEVPLFVLGVSMGIYKLRRRGVNKYLLWGPVLASRVIFADQIFPPDALVW